VDKKRGKERSRRKGKMITLEREERENKKREERKKEVRRHGQSELRPSEIHSKAKLKGKARGQQTLGKKRK